MIPHEVLEKFNPKELDIMQKLANHIMTHPTEPISCSECDIPLNEVSPGKQYLVKHRGQIIPVYLCDECILEGKEDSIDGEIIRVTKFDPEIHY
jgi:hypothetical protein